MVTQEWAKGVMAGKLSKSDKLGTVDHSKIDYPPFRRNFYIEVQELQKMSEEDVAKYRLELDAIKVRARYCLACIITSSSVYGLVTKPCGLASA